MPSFVTVTEHRASPEACFGFITDLSKWPSFTGFGPLPGILSAATSDGRALGVGSVVRVQDSDGSSHEEVIRAFAPPSTYAVSMRLSPPATFILARIEEHIDIAATTTGSRITRRFEVLARSIVTWPLAWLVMYALLRPAVRRHDAAVSRILGAAGACS